MSIIKDTVVEVIDIGVLKNLLIPGINPNSTDSKANTLLAIAMMKQELVEYNVPLNMNEPMEDKPTDFDEFVELVMRLLALTRLYETRITGCHLILLVGGLSRTGNYVPLYTKMRPESPTWLLSAVYANISPYHGSRSLSTTELT